jgi:hypothetical protein
LRTFSKLIKYRLLAEFPNNTELQEMQRPSIHSKIMFFEDIKYIEERGKVLDKYLQEIVDKNSIFFMSTQLKRFLNISATSCIADYGPKGL